MGPASAACARCLLALSIICTANALGIDAVEAKYSAQATGQGAAKAITVATPPLPGVASTFPLLSCSVTVTWPTPPAGVSYTIYRVLLGTSSVVVATTTASGSFSESFLLSALLGTKPTYSIRASLTAASAWIKNSAQAAAC